MTIAIVVIIGVLLIVEAFLLGIKWGAKQAAHFVGKTIQESKELSDETKLMVFKILTD